jgi:hypothetical protein
MRIEGLEVIGYNPETGTFPSTVFASMFGSPIPFRYELDNGNVTISTDFAGGATFRGSVSEDGNHTSGGWRPNEGVDNPGNIAYDISGSRVG